MPMDSHFDTDLQLPGSPAPILNDGGRLRSRRTAFETRARESGIGPFRSREVRTR